MRATTAVPEDRNDGREWTSRWATGIGHVLDLLAVLANELHEVRLPVLGDRIKSSSGAEPSACLCVGPGTTFKCGAEVDVREVGIPDDGETKQAGYVAHETDPIAQEIGSGAHPEVAGSAARFRADYTGTTTGRPLVGARVNAARSSPIDVARSRCRGQ